MHAGRLLVAVAGAVTSAFAALAVVCTAPTAVASAAAQPSPASAAPTVTISPLNGTPDASAHTQISFLGVPLDELRDVSVRGSRSGAHSGSLRAYASAPGASFLPARPFAEGERVQVSALVGRSGETRRVTSAFTVARRDTAYRFTAQSRTPPLQAGAYQSFVSAPTLKPTVVAITADSPLAAPGDIFLTFQHGNAQFGPMIVEDSGRLVWFYPAPRGEEAMDLQVQDYRGAPALVWWQGHIANLGVGFGVDRIYSSSYEPLAEVRAGNGYWADLHDVQLTPGGAAFVTAYTLVHADLAAVGGPRDGVLLDSLLQEVDVQTGLVMFEWHAWGHVALADSYSSPPASSSQPWDWFHINSISPGPGGDVLVSSRNTWAAYDVSLATGRVLWRLGGKRASFRMGPGTATAWQHDVRWQPDGTITLFDDGANPKVHAQSRAIRERIDWANRSVQLVGSDVHAPALLAGSQGNDELLPDGDSFVGWGSEPYFSEYTPSGQLVLDGHVRAPGQSYRAYKFAWSGTPAYPPSLAVQPAAAGDTAYASWNGATGVAQWRVLGGANAASLAPLATVSRSGFETAIGVPTAASYAVQALDAAGRVLGTSAIVAPQN